MSKYGAKKVTIDGITFDSKAEASKFVGRSHGYVSNLLKKGENKVDDYEIYMQVQKGGGAK